MRAALWAAEVDARLGEHRRLKSDSHRRCGAVRLASGQRLRDELLLPPPAPEPEAGPFNTPSAFSGAAQRAGDLGVFLPGVQNIDDGDVVGHDAVNHEVIRADYRLTRS